jgi:RimJ/RimL family protein N-acetyltransferase
MVPRLTTDRLLLREAQRGDFEGFAAVLAEENRPIPPGPVDRRTAWRIFTSCHGIWLLDGFGWWTIEERATGAYVGSVGAFMREPAPGPNGPNDLELGWNLVASLRGRGYATEAAAAALAHAQAMNTGKRIIANIDHGNIASIRVAEKIGMRYEREVPFYDTRLRLYVH